MPRMRRTAIEKRQKPQLALGVWEHLNGKPYEELSVGTKWDLLVLPTCEPNESAFWKRIREAVENGELEVAVDKVHRIGDPPLVAGTRGTRFSSRR
jgi:hypothetical protein